MNLKLSVLIINVINIFIFIIISFSLIWSNEDRLLLKIIKMFIRLFFIKGFLRLSFLCDDMTITI